MYKVLLFGGTVEGRTVAEYLNENKIPAMVCVATEYGESLLPQGEYLELSHDRLNEKQMEEKMLQMEDGLVIDATHPYAQVVTENIEAACERTGTAYLRVVRQESQRLEEEETITYVKSIREAVEYLEGTSGNILVTTGSKELASYTSLTDYQERIYARVLSLVEVVSSCASLGIEGKHLLCMQGPFSKEMNVALIHQFDIAWMVSKESGRAGGFLEKYQAAKETGCKMIVIGRPKEEHGVELEECIGYLKRRFVSEENVTNDAKNGITDTNADNIESAENPETESGKIQGTVAQESVTQETFTRETKEAAEDILLGQKVSLVGIGMGTPDTLTQEGKQALESADLLIGARRMVEHIKRPGQEVWTGYKPEEICAYIAAHPEHKNVAIALSGDVGFYSGAKKLLETLHRELPMVQKKVYCGISSMIYFCAKLETPWEDVHPVSLHGRECNLPGLLRIYGKIFAIVGTTDGIAKLCQKLQSYGMGDVRVEVGERLSYPEEKITRGYAWQLTELETDSLSVVLFTREGKETVVTHGIPDEAFIRGKVPMTKEEVRSISLSKLQLTRNSVIYDVGAGTGSVSVEMAMQAVEGQVYAIEKKPEAVELLYKNKEKFAADNLTIIEGLAPEACVDLPVPTHAFIGGSSGNMKEILELLLSKNPKIRVVINCIALESVGEAMNCLKELPLEQVDIAQVQVAKGKKAGSYHLMMGQNPVYVISCQGKEETDE
ncbi:precorrin-6A reductase [Blautia faecicola]|uniref:precorrin-6A reductase n=1 Tax=Blautia faecicola TaxID=2509240 RepID=UPI003FD7934F